MRFEEACTEIGRDLTLVQGPGGNISWKTSPTMMHIKASGMLLKDVMPRTGSVAVNPEQVAAYLHALPSGVPWTPELEENYLRVLRAASTGDSMPSLETGFHAILSRAVVHTHPLLVNALGCSRDGPDLLRRLFPNAIVVPYATVGIILSRRILDTGARAGDARPIFLLNHGLITHAESMEDAVNRTRGIVERVRKEFERRGVPLPQDMTGEEQMPSQHLFPDSAIYCARKSGTLASRENAYAAAYLLLATGWFGGAIPLPDDEVPKLKGMASEKYRKERER